MKIGILALQGAVSPHQEKIRALGADPIEVRRAQDLAGISGLILPGGESTAMLHLIECNHLWEELHRFTLSQPAFGVCAGAILLAQSVTSPSQRSLGVMAIETQRNAYGRQVDSFIEMLEVTGFGQKRLGTGADIEGVFIRAPRLKRLDSMVLSLVEREGECVLAESGRHLAATFHPELSAGNAIHAYFLEKCHQQQR